MVFAMDMWLIFLEVGSPLFNVIYRNFGFKGLISESFFFNFSLVSMISYHSCLPLGHLFNFFICKAFYWIILFSLDMTLPFHYRFFIYFPKVILVGLKWECLIYIYKYNGLSFLKFLFWCLDFECINCDRGFWYVTI